MPCNRTLQLCWPQLLCEAVVYYRASPLRRAILALMPPCQRLCRETRTWLRLAEVDSDRRMAWMDGDDESSSDCSDAPSGKSAVATLSAGAACRAKVESACGCQLPVKDRPSRTECSVRDSRQGSDDWKTSKMRLQHTETCVRARNIWRKSIDQSNKQQSEVGCAPAALARTAYCPGTFGCRCRRRRKQGYRRAPAVAQTLWLSSE